MISLHKADFAYAYRVAREELIGDKPLSINAAIRVGMAALRTLRDGKNASANSLRQPLRKALVTYLSRRELRALTPPDPLVDQLPLSTRYEEWVLRDAEQAWIDGNFPPTPFSIGDVSRLTIHPTRHVTIRRDWCRTVGFALPKRFVLEVRPLYGVPVYGYVTESRWVETAATGRLQCVRGLIATVEDDRLVIPIRTQKDLIRPLTHEELRSPLQKADRWNRKHAYKHHRSRS